MMRTTLLTDGTPTAMALSRWLERHAGPQRIVAAQGPGDVSTVLAARHREGERVLVLAPATSNTTAATAYACADEALRSLLPIEKRVRGADILDAHRLQDEAFADALDRLLNLVQPRKSPRRPRSGRPPGSNPFRGAGFDICVALLLHANKRWTERDIAATAFRSPSQVHKVLRELKRRGYVVATTKADHVIRDPLVLRDELAVAWRGRVGFPRAGLFALVKGKDKLQSLFRSAMRANRRCRLAGPSAVGGAARLVGGNPIAYLELDNQSSLSGFEGLEPGGKGVGDVIIWPALEAGVFIAPKSLGAGLKATNEVVTYLDLVAMGTDRASVAAEALWTQVSK